METETVERELRGLEEQYWRAIKERDIGTLMRLTADPCLVTGAQGVGLIHKKTFEGMMRDASWTLHEFELTDFHALLISQGVAITAYHVREELTAEGEPVTLNAYDASTWLRRDGRWVCVLHTESIAGDPFGRDRKP